jgi:hypothetical protein
MPVFVVVERTISAPGYAAARAGTNVRAASTSPTLMAWTQNRCPAPFLSRGGALPLSWVCAAGLPICRASLVNFGTNPHRCQHLWRYFPRVARRKRYTGHATSAATV